MTEDRPKRRWQNLLHKKCPNCNCRMEEKGEYLVCRNPNTILDPRRASADCFFIGKKKAIELLMNPDHPAHICLSFHEREQLAEGLRELGAVV